MRNQQHFRQAEIEGKLFTEEPLKAKFNWNASTNEAELVLEGSYTNDDLTTVKRLFLDHLQRVTPTITLMKKYNFLTSNKDALMA